MHRHLAFPASLLSIGLQERLQVHPRSAFGAPSSGSNGAVPATRRWVAPDRPFRLIPIVLRLRLLHVEYAGAWDVRARAGPTLGPGRSHALSVAIHDFDLRPGQRIHVAQEAVVVVKARCSTELVWLNVVLWRSELGGRSLHDQATQFLCHITYKVISSHR